MPPSPRISWRLLAPLLVFLWFAAWSTTARSAPDPQSIFDAAARAYEQGHYQEAIQSYEGLLTNGVVTPALLFNAGNAWLKLEETGRAIACYREARRLAPRDADIAANLRLARAQVAAKGGAAPTEGFIAELLLRLSPREWLSFAVIGSWLAGALLVLRELVLKFRPSTGGLARLITSVAIAAVVLAFAAIELDRRPMAVVIGGTPARFGPLEEAQTAFTFPDGSEVRITDRKEPWLEVRGADGRTGWVKSSALIRLHTARSSPGSKAN